MPYAPSQLDALKRMLDMLRTEYFADSPQVHILYNESYFSITDGLPEGEITTLDNHTNAVIKDDKISYHIYYNDITNNFIYNKIPF